MLMEELDPRRPGERPRQAPERPLPADLQIGRETPPIHIVAEIAALPRFGMVPPIGARRGHIRGHRPGQPAQPGGIEHAAQDRNALLAKGFRFPHSVRYRSSTSRFSRRSPGAPE